MEWFRRRSSRIARVLSAVIALNLLLFAAALVVVMVSSGGGGVVYPVVGIGIMLAVIAASLLHYTIKGPD